MSEPRTGRELTTRDEDGGVARSPDGDQAAVERFSSPARAHAVGLTEERAAQVVRQSGNARNVAFLAILVLALFIPVYWFYDQGIPAVGAEGRMERETEVQYVTDVSRGYALYLANCARCHGDEGKGGIGPPLNDQAKLHDAVTEDGRSGKGHLNPSYLKRVLEVGGRYVCGDPNSLMPAWLQPAGPLNYRQVEELILFLTASTETEWEYPPEGAHLTEEVEPRTETGWRDPAYTPDPAAPTPPACWRNPSGQIGGSAPVAAPSAAAASVAPVAQPGTPEQPRVIKLTETAALEILDESGAKATQVVVKAGETVRFEVTNVGGVTHNFYIGKPADLDPTPDFANLVGIPDFAEGTQTFDYTVPNESGLQFACVVPGHYFLMHGDLVIEP